MVKALTDRNPTFLQQAYKFNDLELLNELSTVKRGERFIRWRKGFQVCRMPTSRVPQICGTYPDLITAMFYAKR